MFNVLSSPLLGEGLGVRLFLDRQLLLLSQFDANGEHLGHNPAENT